MYGRSGVKKKKYFCFSELSVSQIFFPHKANLVYSDVVIFRVPCSLNRPPVVLHSVLQTAAPPRGSPERGEPRKVKADRRGNLDSLTRHSSPGARFLLVKRLDFLRWPRRRGPGAPPPLLPRPARRFPPPPRLGCVLRC